MSVFVHNAHPLDSHSVSDACPGAAFGVQCIAVGGACEAIDFGLYCVPGCFSVVAHCISFGSHFDCLPVSVSSTVDVELRSLGMHTRFPWHALRIPI